MNKIPKKPISFKTRLFLSVGSIFLLLALIVCFLFSKTSISNAVESDKSSADVVLERISTQISSLYEQMNIAATSITKNPTLKSIILRRNTSEGTDSPQYNQIQQERAIRTALGNMMFSPIISNVLLYNQEKNYFYYSGTYYGDVNYFYDTLAGIDTYQYFESVPVIYEPPHQSPWTSEERMVLSVLRNFSDADTTRDTIVEIQVPCQFLEDICTQDTFKEEKEILILDSEGSIVYPYDKQISTLPDKSIAQIQEQIASGKNRHDSYAYSYSAQKSDDTGFTVVLLSNNRTIQKQVLTYLITTLIVAGFTLAVTLILIFTLISKVTHPLNQLISNVNALSLDNDTRFMLPTDTLDEFEILNTSLNQMVSKLKSSIQEIYELQIRESNANLAALQAQVDPHFLYNALSSISAASEVYDSDITTKMCQELSSMMRYVTSNQTEVPLFKEMAHTKNYLDFMKISNGSNFDYIIDVPQELHNLMIPKLSIQPFAENSFRHGFKNTVPPWHLAINCHTDGNNWEITITDNGGGFSQDALSHISRTPVEASGLEINGLGLNNTFSRLSLYLGETFSYRVENLPSGCRIILKGAQKHD